MAYSTATTILILLPGLPQTNTSQKYSQTVQIIESHITRADNIINGKIARRYDCSQFSTDVPPLLNSISEDITSFYVYRSLYSSDNQNFSDYTDKFNDAMETLNEIMNGDLDLVDVSCTVIDPRSSTTVVYVDSNTDDYEPTFDEGDVLNQRADPDKLVDIWDSKS